MNTQVLFKDTGRHSEDNTEENLSTVSNLDFLSVIFPGVPVGASPAVCTKFGDPAMGGWMAHKADVGAKMLMADRNNYFNCSSFNEIAGIPFDVKKNNFAACHFLMLDDLGGKVLFKNLGDFEPSWLIETSPGNFQAGIILDFPITDADEANQLLKAIIAAGLCDDGSNGPISRWARLPVGINGKRKYADPLGQPFQCRLAEWRPMLKYSVAEIIKGLNLVISPINARTIPLNSAKFCAKKTYDKMFCNLDDIASPVVSAERVNEIARLLHKIDPDLPYADWINVLAAVFHETAGTDIGLQLVNTWSQEGKKFKGIAEVEAKWRSFSRGTTRPRTMGTLKLLSGVVGRSVDAQNDDEFITCETNVIGMPDTQKCTKSFQLDNAQPLPPQSFPNPPRSGSVVPGTIPNLRYLLKEYRIDVRYNVISKKLLVKLPGHSGTLENADNVALTHIVSLAMLNGMPHGHIPEVVSVLGDRDPYNPVADWITSLPWDGTDRLKPVYETLEVREGFSVPFKELLIKRWLISAVAAVFKKDGFHSRGVLTLQGPQAIGKTSWIKALVSDERLREKTIKLGHHLDAGDKDSKLTAVSHWIVEIGELDSSFKKDIARLKGFLTDSHDKIRRPYARGDSEYERRTVFCASVNDNNFLVDSTGNSRWWTLPVLKINFNHGIDMQQVFAQLAVEFHQGAIWWLTPDEEAELETFNDEHRMVSIIFSRLLDGIDMVKIGAPNLPAMSASEVLKRIGVSHPTNGQAKECAAFLRQHLGQSKRINGRDTWRVPLGELSHEETSIH